MLSKCAREEISTCSKVTIGLIVGLGLAAPAHAASFSGLGGLAFGETVDARAISADGTTIVGTADDAAGQPQAFRWTASTGLQAIGLPSGSTQMSFGTGVSSDGSVVVGNVYPTAGVFLDGEAFRWEDGDATLTAVGVSLGGPTGTAARDVSANGNVIVGSVDPPASAPVSDPFNAARYATLVNNWVDLDTLGGLGDTNFATAVSDDGQVVVGQAVNFDGDTVAFRATSGFVAGLGFLPNSISSFSTANGISGDGTVIVGHGSISSSLPLQPFRHTAADGLTALPIAPGFSGGLAYGANLDGSVIVGNSIPGLGLDGVATVWTDDAGPRLLEHLLAEQDADGPFADWELKVLFGVSDDGLTFVGNGINPSGVERGFIVTLDTLALPVELEGDYNDDGFVSQADLDLVLLNWGDSVIPPEWVATDQFDGVQVSQNELDGVLLNWGNGTPPTENAAVVPEPGFVVLWSTLVGVVVIRSRRFRAGDIL